MAHEQMNLTRSCPAVAIPSGEPVELPQGTAVVVTQSLGGSYTVMTTLGQLVRIEGKDADALGLAPAPAAAGAAPGGAAEPADAGPMDRERVERIVWDLLRTCYDPEIPVNIVDLGLIYQLLVTDVEGGHRVGIQLTLTAPGCGMGSVLKAEIENKTRSIPTVKESEVELVMEPPWDPSRMTETARQELGIS